MPLSSLHLCRMQNEQKASCNSSDISSGKFPWISQGGQDSIFFEYVYIPLENTELLILPSHLSIGVHERADCLR